MAGEGDRGVSPIDFGEVTDDQVSRFRRSVTESCDAAGSTGTDRRTDISSTVAAILEDADVGEFLETLGMPAGFVDDLNQQALRFEPTSVSTAQDPVSMVRVMLLSLIDAAWWQHEQPFATDSSVELNPDLVDLDSPAIRSILGFKFLVQVDDLPRRVVRAVARRALSRVYPQSIGMRLPYARPEMVLLLNEIADELARCAPRAPRMWVNSAVRSLTYQDQMRSRGYMAVNTSSHCVGWAADIEMQWMRDRGYGDVLAGLLLEWAERGAINVIDEGQAWHVCAHPYEAQRLRAKWNNGIGWVC